MRRIQSPCPRLEEAVASVAALLGQLLPAIQKVRQASQRQACAANLRQLGMAAHQFHATHRVPDLASLVE